MKALARYAVTGSLSLAIFALPFSLAICHAALGIFIIACLLEGQWKNKIDLLFRNSIVFIFVIFFLLHVIGIAYSEDSANGWFNLEKKISLLLIPLALGSQKVLKKESFQQLLNLFILSCLVATIICFANAMLQYSESTTAFTFQSISANEFYHPHGPGAENPWVFFSYDRLASGIQIHPTYLSLYITFCALTLINLHADSFPFYSLAKKILLLTLFVYFGLFVILLSSRIITLLYLGITFWGAFVLIRKNSRGPLKWAYTLAPVVILSFLIYLSPISRYRIIEEVFSTPMSFYKPGLQSQSTGIHASLWWVALKSMGEINPIIGCGTGDVKAIMKVTGEKYNIRNVLNTNDPHNQYLYTFLGLGVFGLGILILCLGLPAFNAWQQRDYFYLGFITIFGATCAVESALELQKGIVFFAIFNSLLIFQRGEFYISSLKIAPRL